MNLLKEKLIQSILSSNAYIGCKEVLYLKEIATIAYSPNIQEALIQVLQNGDYDKITTFEPAKDLFGEELTVIKFSDEKGKSYYGLYYDSVELWQDPQLIDVFPLPEREAIR